jgi:hypothetical protein
MKAERYQKCWDTGNGVQGLQNSFHLFKRMEGLGNWTEDGTRPWVSGRRSLVGMCPVEGGVTWLSIFLLVILPEIPLVGLSGWVRWST